MSRAYACRRVWRQMSRVIAGIIAVDCCVLIVVWCWSLRPDTKSGNALYILRQCSTLSDPLFRMHVNRLIADNMADQSEWFTSVPDETYVYSAYLDARRRENSDIKIVAIHRRKLKRKRYCLIWYEDQLLPDVQTAARTMLPDDHLKT